MYCACYFFYGPHRYVEFELIPDEMETFSDCCRTNEHKLIKIMKAPSHVSASRGTEMTSADIRMTSLPTSTTSSYSSANDHAMVM